MIKYAFEHHGVESKDFILAQCYPSDQISPEELMFLLHSDSVACSVAQLRVYVAEQEAYLPLSAPVTVRPELRVLIRTTESADLLSRLEALERQLASLMQRDPYSPIPHVDSISINPDLTELDLAVLNAAPLIKKDRNGTYPLPDSKLDFETEKRDLVDFFRQRNVGVDIQFGAATLWNLTDVMQLQPKIIQIDCHGLYSSDCSNFFLAFEHSREAGVLDKVDGNRLAHNLAWKKDTEMIVLVNACYSEAIGSVFLEAGVPCVIAVHNECKIMDEAARVFEKEFYRELFRGSTIKEAFHMAQARIAEEQRLVAEACCCAHTHKRTCKWLQETQRNSALTAHSLHYSRRCCVTFRKSPCEHSIRCTWAQGFMEQYVGDNYTISDEDMQRGQYVVCCCSPELPHDEGTKYKLLPPGSPFHDKRIFDKVNMKTSVEVHNSYSRLTPPFLGKLTYGRHETIYTLVQWLVPKSTVRCVTVSGEPRIGKTTVVKRAAQYCFERKCFNDGVIYVDVTGRTFFEYFFSQMEKELQQGDIKNENDLRSIIKRFALLVIIDGMDAIIDHDEESAKKVLTYLLEYTETPKFIVVSQRRLVLESANHLTVGPLTKHDAASLLYTLAGEEVKERKISLRYLERHNIWDTIGCSPASVHLIAPLLKEKGLDAIVEEHLKKHQDLESRSAALQIIVDNLNHNIPAKELFKLLCHFPYGLFQYDVEMLCRDSSDWELLLSYLVCEKNNIQRGSWCVKHINDCYEARRDISSYLGSREPFVEQVLVVTRHLALAARSLVRAAESENMTEDISDLFVFDASLEVGLWAGPNSPTAFYPLGSISTCFERHERNFQYYTYKKTLEKLYPEHLPEALIPYITEIMLCLATLYIKLGKDSMVITGHLDQCLSTCEKYCLKTANSILKLMKASLNYLDMRCADRVVDQILDYFSMENNKEGQAECYLLKALLNQVTRKTTSPQLKRHNTSEDEFKKTLKLAKQAFECCQNELGLARAILVKSEATSQTAYKPHYLTRLSEAAAIFERFKKRNWHIHCLILQLDYTTRCEEFETARKIIRELAQLVEKNIAHQRLLNEKIQLLYSQIQRKSRNVLSFFKAFPLVKKKINGEFTRAGALTRFPSKFREDLLQALSDVGKVINIRMDVATRNNIKQCIESGTRILHISSEEFSEDALYLETEDGAADIITNSDLSDELFSNSLGLDRDSHGIEVLVLAVQSSSKLAQAIRNKLRIPHVVGIEFENYPMDAESSNTQKLYQDAIIVFCLNFYANILKEESIKEAFQMAKYSMDENLHDHRLILHRNAQVDYDPEVTVVRGGPVLIEPDDPVHERRLFTKAHEGIIHNEIRLQEGEFQDLSPPRALSNVQKLESYTGRQELIYHIIKELKVSRSVHITGQPGSGKTALLHYVGYHLCMRHKYRDGIYYIDCNSDLSITESLRDLMLISSVEQLNDLMDKQDLLLLLDNCDGLIKTWQVKFQSLLCQLVNKYKVTVMLTSCVEMEQVVGLELTHLKLIPLSCEERAAMVLSLEPGLTREQLGSERQYPSIAQALADNDLLKQSGLPKKIKDLVRNNFSRNSPYVLHTPSEVSSRKPSLELDTMLVDDIRNSMLMITRENSVTAPGEEELKAERIQTQLESRLYNPERRRCRAKD